ncbi:MAG: phosphotransferase [Balneolaceae bacterium]
MREPSLDSLLRFVQKHHPKWTPFGEMEPLSGGNLNHLYRLGGTPEPVIVKHAPPYIAADPDTPLNPERLRFESDALQAFMPGGALSHLSEGSPDVRPPRWIGFDPGQSLLAMEDLGNGPNISEALLASRCRPSIGAKLGAFIGRLHASTADRPELKEHFTNSSIQLTRHQVQYRPAAEWLSKRSPELQNAAGRIEQLGVDLQKPGRCLIMGDLWPPSIMVQNGQLRLFDWEFVHYGRPLQDVGHFAAHLLLLAIADPHIKQAVGRCWIHFRNAYLAETENQLPGEWNLPEVTNLKRHIGAELWMRTAGPFRNGYLFSGMSDSDPRFQHAVQLAVRFMSSS